MNVSKRKPQIFAIFGGSILNQRIFRAASNNNNDSIDCTWTEHHDQHWHHEGSSRMEYKSTLNLVNELEPDHTFMFSDNLKLRKKKSGLIIAQGRTAYFVNDKGYQFLKSFGNRLSVKDIERVCEKLSISKKEGLEFFKKIITFGLLKCVNNKNKIYKNKIKSSGGDFV